MVGLGCSIAECLNCQVLGKSSRLFSNEQYRTDTDGNFAFDFFRGREGWQPDCPDGRRGPGSGATVRNVLVWSLGLLVAAMALSRLLLFKT